MFPHLCSCGGVLMASFEPVRLLDPFQHKAIRRPPAAIASSLGDHAGRV